MICIWCLKQADTLSREHLIPEMFACPDHLVRDDIACEECNNKLGLTVDAAVAKQFELINFINGIRGKKGKKPKVSQWAAVAGYYEGGRPVLSVNAGPSEVKDGGKKLAAAHRSNGITDAWILPEEGRSGFDQQFGNDPKFVRGVYKIGLNGVAHYLGPDVAASKIYDHVRAFVLGDEDVPRLKMLVDAADGKLKCEISAPIVKQGRKYPMFQITLPGVHFLIDMTPDQSNLRDIRGAATLTLTPLCIL